MIWLGILFCLSQSAMFSGLNLAFFSLTRLRLEIEASHDNKAAKKVLKMRSDSNFLLTTILFGNVGINVLLTLLSNSVMAGVVAFLFSTFVITFLGEIIPQAYFSRNALKMASFLAPILKFYQIILYPFAKPSAIFLDLWLGEESIQYFKEESLKQLIQKHVEDSDDIDHVEGTGAINFLAIDDLLIQEEGEIIDPSSIVKLKFIGEQPQFPKISKIFKDKFIARLNKSGKKWSIITNEQDVPKLVIDTDGFIRSSLLHPKEFNPYHFAHSPIIFHDSNVSLGEAIKQLKVNTTEEEDDRIAKDIIIVWGDAKRIITGTDILGRLLRGIIASE